MTKVSSLIIALLGCQMCLWGAETAAPSKDVTASMEKIVSPFAKKFKTPYGRNVWAMMPYQGRLYIGAGNSSNGGPDSNCGPIPVYSMDPATRQFKQEWTVPDEQIDVFRIIDGALVIPGHDPKEDWKFGNFYRLKSGKDAAWEKIRTIPGGVHCYDVAKLNGKLYAAGYGSMVSDDDGATFRQGTENARGGSRLYTYLTFPKRLYAFTEIRVTYDRYVMVKNEQNPKGPHKLEPAPGSKQSIFVTGFSTGKDGLFHAIRNKNAEKPKPFTRPAPMPYAAVIPDTVPPEEGITYKVMRSIAFKDRVLYTAAIVHNDHQGIPFGVYTAIDDGGENAVAADFPNEDGTPIFRSQRIQLPEGAKPWALAATDKTVLVLFSVPGADGTVVNHVWKSTDGVQFTPLVHFTAPTFARSFAYLNGRLYFGLGTEFAAHGKFSGNNTLAVKWSPDELNAAAGEIWCVEQSVE